MKSPSPAGKAQSSAAAEGRAPDGSRGCGKGRPGPAASLRPGIWGFPDSGGFCPGGRSGKGKRIPPLVPACHLQLSWQGETMGKWEGVSWDLSPAGAASFCGLRDVREGPRSAPRPSRFVRYREWGRVGESLDLLCSALGCFYFIFYFFFYFFLKQESPFGKRRRGVFRRIVMQMLSCSLGFLGCPDLMVLFLLLFVGSSVIVLPPPLPSCESGTKKDRKSVV